MKQADERNKAEKVKRSRRGTGSVYRRGVYWWFSYSHNGKLYRETSESDSKSRAQKMLAARLSEIQEGKFSGPKREKTLVKELWEPLRLDYENNHRKSLDDLKRRWKLHVGPFFDELRVAQVSSDHVARYIGKRLKQGASNATVNRELAALKRAFYIGYEATPPRVMRVPSIKLLEEDNTRQGFFEDDNYDKLVAANPDLWFRALVAVGREFGWRVFSELLAMRVKQVDLDKRVVRLEPGTTKNKAGREAGIPKHLLPLLAACIQGKEPDGFVFTRPNGRPIRDFRVTWGNACVSAGLGRLYCRRCLLDRKREVPVTAASKKCPECGEKLTVRTRSYRGLIFHDLRRTAARNMRRAGIPEHVVMKRGGWKTAEVFHRYDIQDYSDQMDAAQKMDQQAAERVARVNSQLIHNDPETAPEAGNQEIKKLAKRVQ